MHFGLPADIFGVDGVIILIVVAFPKGIVGMLEAVHNRRRRQTQKAALLTSRIETAE